MTFVSFVSGLALFLSLMGNLMIATKNKNGYIIWIISNILWIVVNFIDHLNPSQVLMYLTYTALNVYGFFNWKESEESRKNKRKTTIEDERQVIFLDMEHDKFQTKMEVPEFVVNNAHTTDGVKEFRCYIESETAKQLGVALMSSGYIKQEWSLNDCGRPELVASVRVIKYDKEDKHE